MHNVEKALNVGARIQVYYFEGLVGHGHVAKFTSAGMENLKRERIYAKKKRFQESEDFQFCLEAGLETLSKEPGATDHPSILGRSTGLFWNPCAPKSV